ncbi:hypothetical protein C8R47DRAFT_1218733 [Mycena vitilis]|nr:hypothetical protein C8R47DRAFT_1218733 [Mycena vitilis]
MRNVLFLICTPTDPECDTTVQTGGFMTANEEKDNPEHEAAAPKLWAVYVSEAEKYD